MIKPALTFSQASKLQARFCHLRGAQFDRSHREKSIIECVAVAPYDEINKHIFLLSYDECRDAEAALLSYPANVFDVIVIARQADGFAQIISKDLDDYLMEHNIPVDQVYETIR